MLGVIAIGRGTPVIGECLERVVAARHELLEDVRPGARVMRLQPALREIAAGSVLRHRGWAHRERLPRAGQVMQERVVRRLQRHDERGRVRRRGLSHSRDHVGGPLGDLGAPHEGLPPGLGVGEGPVVELHVRLQAERVRQLIGRDRPRLRQAREELRGAWLVVDKALVGRFHDLHALALVHDVRVGNLHVGHERHPQGERRTARPPAAAAVGSARGDQRREADTADSETASLQESAAVPSSRKVRRSLLLVCRSIHQCLLLWVHCRPESTAFAGVPPLFRAVKLRQVTHSRRISTSRITPSELEEVLAERAVVVAVPDQAALAQGGRQAVRDLGDVAPGDGRRHQEAVAADLLHRLAHLRRHGVG